MPRTETHTIILNDLGAAVSLNSPFQSTYNINSFLTQIPFRGANAQYRLGVSYFHFNTNLTAIDTLNIVCEGFSQNKNRIYFNSTTQPNGRTSNIIASIGQHEGGNSFNYHPEQVHMVEGYFSSTSTIAISFLDQANQIVNWNPGGNGFQLNLLVEVIYDE
jgi:hypothetical protein